MRDGNKEWQVETQGSVYYANLEELKQWIAETAVLPTDRVRREGLRWLRVEMVPELRSFIRQFAHSEISSTLYGTSGEDVPGLGSEIEDVFCNVDPAVCYYHNERSACFVCGVCDRSFCKWCPKSFGGTVRLCPDCESLLRSIEDKGERRIAAMHKPVSNSIASSRNSVHNLQGQGRMDVMRKHCRSVFGKFLHILS